MNAVAGSPPDALAGAGEEGAAWGAWMAAAQSGDRAAYARLLGAILPFLRAIARRYLRHEEDAEDMVQEILIVVHDIRHTYEPGRPFKPWLGTIAARRCIDGLRRRTRRAMHELGDEDALAGAADDGGAPDALLEQRDAERAVDAALGALPPRQREALHLLRVEELSLAEAAALSEQSVGSLKVACHRAMKALQRRFTGREDA